MHPIIAMRQLDGLDKDVVRVLSAANALSQADILQQLKGRVTQPSLSRSMSRLIDMGIIQKTGTTRNAAFSLTPETKLFARPAHLRPPVQYDPTRIGSYVPNQTRWLSLEAEDVMRKAAASVQHQLDASTYSKQIAERFLIDLSWASSALEGNTYDYLETEALIKYGNQAQGHDLIEATMILNHKKAINFLLDNIDKPLLEQQSVQRLHALLMLGLVSPEDLGRIRANDVQITGTAYRPTGDNYQLASDFGSLLWKVDQVESPFEASFVLLAGMSYLQAFVDGNKRIGRLSSNIPLLQHGLPPLSFMGVDRAEYLAGLIYFYETSDTTLLGNVVSSGYAEIAPSYRVAVATHRQPRSVELRERANIDSFIRNYVEHTLNGEEMEDDDLSQQIQEAFDHLAEADYAIVSDNVIEAIEKLNNVNSIVWGISPEDADRFSEIRNNRGVKLGHP